jgi:error-prone DNA polymerase
LGPRLRGGDKDECAEEGNWVASTFPGNAFIAVELHRGPDDDARIAELEVLGRKLGMPCLAAGDVHMHERRRKKLQDVMTRFATSARSPKRASACSPTASGTCARSGAWRPSIPRGCSRSASTWRAGAGSRSMRSNTSIRTSSCRRAATPTTHLRKLTFDGLTERYPQGAPAEVVRTVEHELTLIEELKYEPFFLTVHDVVRYARSQDILCQGRGSAANSSVCYCLGITEVDPGRMSVLFERFISKERNEPPDIDVDFEHQRREEVIQYIYESTARARRHRRGGHHLPAESALRDVGKALGLSLDQVDLLAKSMSWWDDRRRLRSASSEGGFDLATA